MAESEAELKKEESERMKKRITTEEIKRKRQEKMFKIISHLRNANYNHNERALHIS